ncbi:tetratricopeptide repeat protein [Ruegeria lacuscaerulensis]|uniref:tetratricopeptide repeat protein n=1 Tax=Ruegeria lacuscaerulensis TaxID=55218 RepID=UPI00147E3C86|nr:tetratricopeptide repeat protein [Ruegeria lacuscaerulensis]
MWLLSKQRLFVFSALLLSAKLVALQFGSFQASAHTNSDWGQSNRLVLKCRDAQQDESLTIDACSELLSSSWLSDDKLASYLLERAKAYRRAKRYELAASDLANAIELRPEDSQLWVEKAILSIALGDNQQAEEFFEYALKLDPVNIGALRVKADFDYRRNKKELARKGYERVTKINPSDFVARQNQSAILIGQKKYDRALKLYKAIFENRPDDYGSSLVLSILYLHYEKDKEKALEIYSWAMSLKPDPLLEMVFPAIAHLKLGDEEAGMVYIEKLSESFRENPKYKVELKEEIRKWENETELEAVNAYRHQGKLFRAVAFAMAGREDLTKKEFEEFIALGGSYARYAVWELIKDFSDGLDEPSHLIDEQKRKSSFESYVRNLNPYASLEKFSEAFSN